MKKSILFILCLALPIMTIAQPLAVRKAFHRYGHDEGITRVTVPGIAIRMASWLVDDAETEALLKGINKVKVLFAEGEENMLQPEFASKFMKEIKRGQFEEMLTMNDQEDQVGIYIRDGRRHKKELVLFVSGKDESTIVYLKGKITPELLKQLSDNPGNTKITNKITI